MAGRFIGRVVDILGLAELGETLGDAVGSDVTGQNVGPMV